MPRPDPVENKPPQHRKSRLAATLKILLRTRITAGLLVVMPIWITILLIRFVFQIMRDSSQWVVLAVLRTEWFQKHVWQLHMATGEKLDIDQFLSEHRAIYWGIALLSVFFTFCTLYLIGLTTRNIVGRRIIASIERLVDKVPLVKTVYRSSKQILATFTGEQSNEFQRTALIPFPQEKMRSVGFITAVFPDSVTGEELATVFIPTTPNPTTGYLQVLRRKDLVELDWSVEDAVRTIMSAGILRPDFLTIVPGSHLGTTADAPAQPSALSQTAPAPPAPSPAPGPPASGPERAEPSP